MRSLTRSGGLVMLPAARMAGSLHREPQLTVVGWHRIDDGPTGLSTSFDDFRRHLDVLAEWGGCVLPLAEAVGRLADGSLPDRAVALTFDDGYASVVERAWPELLRRGLPATLFAVSGYLDDAPVFPWDHDRGPGDDVRLVDRTLLREAADSGLEIGSHTVTHRWLPQLSPAEVAEELRASRAQLEELLDRPVRSLAYPAGRWNAEIRAEAARAGYQVGITVDRGRNGRHAHPLSLARAFAFDRASDFRMQLHGAYTWLRVIEGWRSR
jgi:peptidoglycan/xylan/chitin deacetylase (PgdA/CDA1 family)